MKLCRFFLGSAGTLRCLREGCNMTWAEHFGEPRYKPPKGK